jgi:hypothetical protein
MLFYAVLAAVLAKNAFCTKNRNITWEWVYLKKSNRIGFCSPKAFYSVKNLYKNKTGPLLKVSSDWLKIVSTNGLHSEKKLGFNHIGINKMLVSVFEV